MQLEVSLEPSSAMALLLDHRKFAFFCGRVREKGHGCCLGDQGDAKLSWSLCCLSQQWVALPGPCFGDTEEVRWWLCGVQRVIWALLPSLQCQCQHPQQGSPSTVHVVLSEPGQSCQQVTAFTPALCSTPERQSPSSPVSVPDSTFLLVPGARRQLVRQLHLAPAKAKCWRSP